MFTLTANSSLAASGGTGIYFPSSGLVMIFGGASNSSNMGIDTTLATVPQKYRPNSNRGIYCRFNTDANVNYVAGSCAIHTDGTIKQGGTGYARSVDFWGVYQI